MNSPTVSYKNHRFPPQQANREQRWFGLSEQIAAFR